MVRINKETLTKLVEQNFFDEWKTLKHTIDKLARMGFTIENKKIGLVAQLLAFLCQDGLIEREKLPKSEWKVELGRWKYKRVV